MRIGLIGATGNIGSRVLAEATSRGHDVMPFTRSGAANRGSPWRDLDLFDSNALRSVVNTVDVIISAFHPGNTARDPVDALQQAIADPSAYARAAASLMKALESRPAARVIVVGGAANLEIAPGRTTDDDEAGLREVLRGLGVPEDYAVAAKGHRDALNVLRSAHVEPALDVCNALRRNLRRRPYRQVPAWPRPTSARYPRSQPYLVRGLCRRHPRRNRGAAAHPATLYCGLLKRCGEPSQPNIACFSPDDDCLKVAAQRPLITVRGFVGR